MLMVLLVANWQQFITVRAKSKNNNIRSYMSHIHFPSGQRPIYQQLSSTINQYFKTNKINKTGDHLIAKKATFILFAWLISYLLILCVPSSLAYFMWFLHGIVTALVGYNVMHDGAHESFSHSRKTNHVMALTFNLIGSNRFYWLQKHNRNHHAFTNVDELDEDIDAFGIFRMSPHQNRRWFHQYQHWYAWFIYPWTSLIWFFGLDFKAYSIQKIATREFSQRLSLKDHVEFWVSKMVYLTTYIVIPSAVFGAEHVILGFLIMHWTLGFLFAVVFQLAHVVDLADFPRPDENGTMQDEWAVHQLRTTVDFATDNKFLTWALGGLNFQAEHHLFPRISHVHYASMHPILQDRIEQLGYKLKSYPTLAAALRGHYNHLRNLSQSNEIVLNPTSTS